MTHCPTAAPAVQQCGKRIITDKKMGANTKKCSNRTMLSFFIAIFIPDIGIYCAFQVQDNGKLYLSPYIYGCRTSS